MADERITDQWTAKALDTVDTVVATVNDRAVRPVVVVAHAVVFGVIIAIAALVMVVLLCIGLIRLMVVYLPGHHVWVPYLVLGAIFCGLGAFLYAKRGSALVTDD